MLTRSALIYLSRQERLKEFATHFKLFKKLTTRFIAGENINEAIAAIRDLNARGCSASFDHLNESVTSPAETEAEVREYLDVLARIDESGIDSNVSIKLTQFGLEIDPELAYQNARRVVADAARRGNFVRIDMDGSNVTQATIAVFKRLRAESGLNDEGKVSKEGYRMRVHVPYGERWYPYFMRRLAERPANIWFVLKNLWK